ncbi:MAG: hypothetical protein WCK90_03875 [archaeon]
MDKTSVPTITAQIYLGLREGYTDKVHSLDELKEFLHGYCDKGLCVTVSPTTFIYKRTAEDPIGREEGAVIGVINYPRFPSTRENIEKTAEEIASMCKDRYKQNRVSIVYSDSTVMI